MKERELLEDAAMEIEGLKIRLQTKTQSDPGGYVSGLIGKLEQAESMVYDEILPRLND